MDSFPQRHEIRILRMSAFVISFAFIMAEPLRRLCASIIAGPLRVYRALAKTGASLSSEVIVSALRFDVRSHLCRLVTDSENFEKP
jgi:hypothetical protein